MDCGNKSKNRYILNGWRKRWTSDTKLLCVILSNREDDSGVNHRNFRIVNALI